MRKWLISYYLLKMFPLNFMFELIVCTLLQKPKTNHTHDYKNPLSHKKETEKPNKNKKINQRL